MRLRRVFRPLISLTTFCDASPCSRPGQMAEVKRPLLRAPQQPRAICKVQIKQS